MRPQSFALCLLGVFATTGSIRATMIGNSMELDWRYFDSATHNPSSGSYPYAFTVGSSGAAFVTPGTSPLLDISITSDTITLSFPVAGNSYGLSGPPGSPNGATDTGPNGETVTFNGTVFSNLSQAFAGVEVLSIESLAGMDASRVWVSGDELFVNFMGLNVIGGQSEVVLRVQTGGAVPDAGSTSALLGISFGCFAFMRKASRICRYRTDVQATQPRSNHARIK